METEIKALIERLEAEKDKVGISRDALREIGSDVEAIADSCDRAIDDLESAIDALSELC